MQNAAILAEAQIIPGPTEEYRALEMAGRRSFGTHMK